MGFKKNFRLIKLKKKLLSLFKFIVSQKSNNKADALSFLNSTWVDDISESICNILYNEKLNLNFSKSQKAKLKKIIKPNAKSFEDISKRNVPIKRRHTKIIQQGSGIGTILLILIPVLTSLLTKNKKMAKYSPKENTYKEMYLINKFEKDIMENSLQNMRNDQSKTTQKSLQLMTYLQ